MSWYAVQYKPAQGHRAVDNLEYQGVECFFPEIQVETIRAGKRSLKTEPLFKGYLFINIDMDDPIWHKLRSTRGVIRVVGFANKPAAIDDGIIEAIRERLEEVEEEGGLKAGTPMEIKEGPFRGLSAVFQSYDGEERAMILIDFLQKQHRVSMDLANMRTL